MSAVAIRAEGVSKRYVINEGGVHDTLRDTLASLGHRLRGRRPAVAEAREHWALRDVSFTIPRGDVVGVVGRNGAGKSTLLKVLARITEPTTGAITLHGRVASMLEVGTGFHPELTGRENILLSGAILGMRHVELRRRFDEIVEFAEVARFIDTPVKHYSSGMYLKLAFGVAAHLDPDILLVDEVLAVGDHAFQQKCLGKMGEVSRSGRTVLFVSHNMSAVTALCTRGLLLAGGRATMFDSAADAVARYLYDDVTAAPTDARTLHRSVVVERVRVAGPGGAPEIEAGDTVRIALDVVRREAGEAILEVKIHDARGIELLNHRISAGGAGFRELVGPGTIEATVPGVWLAPGVYTVWAKFFPVSLGDGARSIESERAVLVVRNAHDTTGTAVLAPPVEWRTLHPQPAPDEDVVGAAHA